MALQSTTTRAGRRAKSETETPVKKIALPKKTAAAAAPAKTTRKAAVSTAQTGTGAAKFVKNVAPKKPKKGTEGIYETRTGAKVSCKVTGYIDQRNGVWMTVKNADGAVAKIRPIKFTAAA